MATVAHIDRLAAGTWRVDTTATTAGFTVSNFAVNRVSGTFDVTSGSVEVDAAGRPQRVTAVLETASFRTGNDRRDADICAPRFLDAERNPEIRFVAHAITGDPAGWEIDGRLEIGGRAAAVPLRAHALEQADGRLRVTASGVLDRADLGLSAPAFLIGRRVEIDVTATLQLDA